MAHEQLHAVLLIQGIPVAFSDQDGDTVTLTGTPASLTTINAILADSIKLGSSSLNMDTMIVEPSPASLTLRSSSVWDKYFHRKKEPITRLTAALVDTATDTTASVESSSGFAASDYIFCNRETMKIGNIATNDFGDTIRNVMSLGLTTNATHQIGSVVGLAPRYLAGRLAKLVVYSGPYDAPATSTTISLKLAASPVFDRRTNTWALSFDSRMAMLDKKIAVGFKGTKLTDAAVPLFESATDTGTFITFTVEDAREFIPGSEQGAVLLTSESGYAWPTICPLVSASIVDGVHTIKIAANAYASSMFQAQATDASTDLAFFSYAKRVYVFTGEPMQAAMRVLLSDRGHGANGSYDVMAGRTSSGGASGSATARVEANEIQLRFGAGIDASLVAAPSSALLAKRSPGFCYILGTHGEESLIDFLEEIAWSLGGYWYFNSSGLLAFRTIEGAYASESYTYALTENDIDTSSRLEICDDESEIAHTFTVQCNRSLDTGDHLVTANAYYEDYLETYRDNRAGVEFKRNGLVVDAGTGNVRECTAGSALVQAASLDDLRVMLDRQFVRRSECTRRFGLTLPWSPYAAITPGQRVTATQSYLPDLAGSTLATFPCEVVSVAHDLKKRLVTIQCVEVWTANNIAPTLQVATWTAGTKTLTLATGSKWRNEVNATTGQAYWFGSDWPAVLLNRSAAPPFSQSVACTIASITNSTTIVLTAAVQFTGFHNPEAGDILVLPAYDAANATSLSAGNYSFTQHQYTFLADAASVLGAANVAGHKWG